MWGTQKHSNSSVMFVVLVFVAILSVTVSDETLNDRWTSWKIKHERNYFTMAEAAERKRIWLRNYHQIVQHNHGNHSYSLKMNQFSDLSDEEFKALMLHSVGSGLMSSNLHITSNVTDFPRSMDWRERGFVTEVKNQGKCRSSWAFSAIGALEGQNFRQSGFLLDLSAQQAIDCSWLYGNRGCHGGLATNVFQYVSGEQGICSSSSYTYLGYMWHCMAMYCKKVAFCSGHTTVKAGSESDLLDALYSIGPVSVSVDASSYSFKYYHGGTYTDDSCSTKKLNHAMLLVGYGTYGGQDYWIVKNSWGTTWGNQGYMRIARNRNNTCGIATAATYPNVE